MLPVYGMALVGSPIMPEPLTFDQCFGLWLNLSRDLWRKVAASATGTGIAMSNSPIPTEYIDSVTPCEEAVEDAEFAANWSRRKAANEAKVGW